MSQSAGPATDAVDIPQTAAGAAPPPTEAGTAAPWLGAAVAATTAIGAVLWSLPRGLDTTDEGYYLNEIAHPSDSSAVALLFGWFWHPVFAAVDGSVVGVRFIGVAVVAAATVALTLGAIGLGTAPPIRGEAASGRAHPTRATVACLVLVAVALALVPWSVRPATPSYTTLALLALLVTALGCRYLWAGTQEVVGGILVGLGGFLALMSKPTTALALGLAVLILTPWSRRLVRGTVAAVAALLVPSAVLVALVPGHLSQLSDVVTRGVEATVGHTQFVRLDRFSVNAMMVLALLLAGALGALAGFVSRGRSGRPPGTRPLPRHTIAALAGLMAAIPGAFVLVSRWRAGTFRDLDLFHPQASLYVFGLVLALATLAALTSLVRRSVHRPRSVELRFALLLAGLPFAYAFGTNTNIWRFTGQVVVFWFLAILVLTRRSGVLATAAGGIAACTVLVAGISTPLAPYRGAPLIDTVSTQVNRDGQTLRLPLAQARQTAALLEVGHRLGLSRKTAVLDLTGDSPGAIWAWGARPLAQAWVIGGYPDSAKAARVAIAPVACQLDRAFVLVSEPRGRRSLPDDVLSEWGVQVPGDYRVAAEYTVAQDPILPTGAQRTIQVLEPVDVHPLGCPG